MNKVKIRQRIRGKKASPVLRGLEQIPMRVAYYRHCGVDDVQQISSVELIRITAERMIGSIPAWSLAGIYLDQCSYDTPLTERPGFKSMKQNIADYDLVICKSIVSLSPDTLPIVQRFREKGIGFYFEAEDLYSLDDSFDGFLRCFRTVAERESSQKRCIAYCRISTFALDQVLSIGKARYNCQLIKGKGDDLKKGV